MAKSFEPTLYQEGKEKGQGWIQALQMYKMCKPLSHHILQFATQNGQWVFAKFLWLCFISISFCFILGFVHLLFWHKTSLRVSSRRTSFMPKYRYLVVPLGVWVWWAAKGQIPTYLLTLSPPAGWRECRGKKLTGWDNGGLIGKIKAMCASKPKRGICSTFCIGGQLFSHFEKRM